MIDTLYKMFSKFDRVKLSSQLTSVLSNDEDNVDAHQLELWNENIVPVIEVFFKHIFRHTHITGMF